MTTFTFKRGDLVVVRRGLLSTRTTVAVVLGPSKIKPGRLRLAVWSNTPRRWCVPYLAQPGEILGAYPSGESHMEFRVMVTRDLDEADDAEVVR